MPYRDLKNANRIASWIEVCRYIPRLYCISPQVYMYFVYKTQPERVWAPLLLICTDLAFPSKCPIPV